MTVAQAERQARVETPLGADVLVLQGLTGREALGQVAEFELNLLSENGALDAKDLLGKAMTVQLDLEDGETRYFHGHVARFAFLGHEGRLARYGASLRSWPWFLSLSTDCRIFQDKTVPDIIKEVFRGFGFTDFDDQLIGTYPAYEYCVQYRETALNFVSRLMEQEGIYFFFVHEQSRHTLVLVDDISTLEPYSAHYQEVPYFPPDSDYNRERDHLDHWLETHEVRTGRVTLRSYDYLQPRRTIEGVRQEANAHDHDDLLAYDFPARQVAFKRDSAEDNASLPDQHALVRLDEAQARWLIAEGEGTARGLAPGRLFTLSGHPREDQNREYLVLETRYEFVSDEYFTVATPPEGPVWRSHIAVMPSDRRYRPPRRAFKSRVEGPQTAFVTGPSGEEIWTDEFGRVKVQFHWDHEGQSDENSSCWVRVSHPWAGRNWGAIAIPRIGQEVVIDFIEGDPDRPIITGRVYNSVNTVPYALPDNKTQTGIKSRSSKGGTGDNFNEIRFEDKKGSEQVYIHAEKNQDIVVENDETHTVGHDRTKDIGNDETTHVGHDRTETVDNNETITIHANRTERVDVNETISIGGDRSETVSGNETIVIMLTRTEAVGINESVTVGGARESTVGLVDAETIGVSRTVTIGTSYSKSVGTSEEATIGTDRTHSVGDNDQLSVGKDQTIGVGKNYALTAGDQVTITTGSASITMKKDGTIEIRGKDITIDGSGNVNIKAGGKIVMTAQQILQN